MKVKTGCPVAKKCGGCQLSNLRYPEQLEFKQKKVIKFLGSFCRVDDIIGMENPYYYRNKVQAAFGVDRGGKIISGVYQSGTHKIVPVDSCLLEDKIADTIIVTIRSMLKSFKLTVYNEYSEKGFLRHVLVKRGARSGEVMVVIVSSTPLFPRKKDFVKELVKKHPEITTVVHNVNPYKTSLVLGERNEVIYGKGTINEHLLNCVFRISPASFYQINPTQTEKLYSTAISLGEFTGNEILLDAYCGTGTIGIIASPYVKNVIGVELNRDAVKDAIYNAKTNKIDNIYFYCDDAGKFMLEAAKNGNRPDVVIMDPPRSGSTESFLAALCELEIKKVIYVSCNPETQARDLEYLTTRGYAVKKIVPVDMFPHTNHVETVCLLSKK